MKHFGCLLLSVCAVTVAWGAPTPKPASGREAIPVRSANPYLGAIVVDATTGAVLYENRADEQGYPASVVKLMDLLIIEERIDAGLMSLSNRVQITAEAAGIGGSQVYLDAKESFPVEELVAAMTIHSANDAAAALAIHVAGSRSAFVDLMNQRAAELGMTATRFNSVHGLPPAAGQQPDVSTARDLALLAREVLKHKDVLRYTSVQKRPFRNGAFELRNPDHLIGNVPGVDGLKTGYFKAGGFSIVSTAQRNGRRVIVVVLGSVDSKVRDATAADYVAKGLLAAEKIPLPPPPVVVSTNVVVDVPAEKPESKAGSPRLRVILLVSGIALVVLLVGGVLWKVNHPRM